MLYAVIPEARPSPKERKNISSFLFVLYIKIVPINPKRIIINIFFFIFSPKRKVEFLLYYFMSSSFILAPTFFNFSTIFSYPLKMCSALSIVVFPSAISPASTKDAPALKSVAMTFSP